MSEDRSRGVRCPSCNALAKRTATLRIVGGAKRNYTCPACRQRLTTYEVVAPKDLIDERSVTGAQKPRLRLVSEVTR